MPAIVAEGRAVREVAPDVATTIAVVEVDGDGQRETYGDCSARLASLFSGVRDALGPVTAATGPVSVWPRFDDRGRRTGHQASATLRLRGPIEPVTQAAQLALDHGATRLDGPWYEVSTLATIEEELLGEAVASARRRADALARAAGVGVGALLSLADRVGAFHSGPAAEMALKGARSMAVDAPPMVPDVQRVEVVVEAVYAVA